MTMIAKLFVKSAQQKRESDDLAARVEEKAEDVADADRIRNEYAIGLKLKVPGVMQPLELWSYKGRPAIVFDFFDGLPLHREIKSPFLSLLK